MEAPHTKKCLLRLIAQLVFTTMPEGPSIVILKELLRPFAGRRIRAAYGAARVDLHRLIDARITEFKSWGKHLLICFQGFFLRIHMKVFGKCLINRRGEMDPRLRLLFVKGEVNFYHSDVKLQNGSPEDYFDWQTDIMAEEWSQGKAKRSLAKIKKSMISDALLDQGIFSGVGNIIKNEVLFRNLVHPESVVGEIPARKLSELVADVREYSLLVYKEKKAPQKKRHWQIYNQLECPRCYGPVTRKYIGRAKRLTCFCDTCQQLYK
jgi:endonuclease-8